MSDAGFALQDAIYQALTAAPSIGAAVYDQGPEPPAYPHIELAEISALDWSAAAIRGEEHLVTINVWSTFRGFKEAWALMAAIKSRLHLVNLSVSGNTLVLLRYAGSDLFKDADPTIRHGVIRFRAITTT